MPSVTAEAAPAPAPEPEAAPAPAGAGSRTDARPVVLEEEGLVTQAVAMALPSAAAEGSGTRVGIGQTAPLPLTSLATARLIRPEDGDAPFEIGAGGVLIVRVNDRVLSRTEEVMVSCGDLAFEPATRRVRGAATDEIFGDEDKSLFIVTGKGYLVAAAGGQVFTAVSLDDDILYLRETLVFAFEDQLRWENGNVPGSNGQMHVVQFRGDGCVAVRSRRPLLSAQAGGRPGGLRRRQRAGRLDRAGGAATGDAGRRRRRRRHRSSSAPARAWSSSRIKRSPRRTWWGCERAER